MDAEMTRLSSELNRTKEELNRALHQIEGLEKQADQAYEQAQKEFVDLAHELFDAARAEVKWSDNEPTIDEAEKIARRKCIDGLMARLDVFIEYHNYLFNQGDPQYQRQTR